MECSKIGSQQVVGGRKVEAAFQQHHSPRLHDDGAPPDLSASAFPGSERGLDTAYNAASRNTRKSGRSRGYEGRCETLTAR